MSGHPAHQRAHMFTLSSLKTTCIRTHIHQFTVPLFILNIQNQPTAPSNPQPSSRERILNHGRQGAVDKQRIPPLAPVMRQQPPRLLKVLRPAADVIAPGNNPDHPPCLLRGQVLGKTLRVRLEVRGPILREPPLRQQQGEVLDISRHVERLEAVVVQAGRQGVTAADVVGIRVQLEDDLVGGKVVAGKDLRAGRQGGAAHHGGEKGVKVEAREDDEGVRVGVAHGGGAVLDVLVPGLPVVRLLEGGVVVRAADLVAEGEGGQGGP